MKLNLGAGETAIDGFESRDGKRGDVIFPLAEADGSIEEIRASHVLEHFPHRQGPEVLKDWVRALKPGGVLKIAVPDFERIVAAYLEGREIPTEAFVMGGQVDEADFHRAIFDEEHLARMLRAAGLVGVRRWKSEIADCAALPISLNLAGTKPGGPRPKIAAVMSAPRLAFSDNLGCVAQLAKLGVPVRKVTGAFWGQCLTRAIEESLAEHRPEWILTIDYDTVWTPDQLHALLDVAARHPDAAAIAPVQCKRGATTPLFFIRGKDGHAQGQIAREALDDELVQVTSAHFGLTLVNAAALAEIERPWFAASPDADGRWGEGRMDDDIWFWRQLERADLPAFIAPRVVVGHLELMVMWPNQDLEPHYQNAGDFWRDGPPDNLWR